MGGLFKIKFSAFEQMSENGARQASFLVPYLNQHRTRLRKKGVPKIVPKKGAPQDANETLLPGREAPGDGASRAHFQQQKQQFGQQQQQLQQQLQKLLFEFTFCSKLVLDLVFQVIARSRFQK